MDILYNSSITDIEHSPNYTTFCLPHFVYHILSTTNPPKELPAAASVMQISSKELSTLVADRVLKNVNKGCCCCC